MTTPELPDDVSRFTVNLKDSPVVTCGYEVISLVIFIDAVNMEVVPSIS